MTAFTKLYHRGSFIDAVAYGHYARTFEATDHRRGEAVAFKLLRREHIAKEKMWHTFVIEARLLAHFADHPHVVQLLDCGFVNATLEFPEPGEPIHSLQLDVEAFAEQLTDYFKQEWRPYLALALHPESANLYVRLKEANETTPSFRRRLTTEEGLRLALQYANLLQQAHQDDIVYMDAKLPHYYWEDEHLTVIDWNVARDLRRDGHESDPQLQKNKDIRNFILGVLFPVFTGTTVDNGLFDPQPSTHEAVAQRHDNVSELHFDTRSPETYIPSSLIHIMKQGANWNYTSAAQLLEDLRAVAQEYGLDSKGDPVEDKDRCRILMRQGINEIRQAQAHLYKSVHLLMNACGADMNNQEAERLLRLAQHFYDHRILP